MMKYYDLAVEYLSESYNTSWQWVNGLDRQSWLYLLALTTVFGLLCMRGFGSRNNY